MEPYLSTDQQYILRVLPRIGFLSRNQIVRLLYNWDHRKMEHHADAAIRQLLHVRKVIQVKGTDLVSAPFICSRSPDQAVLDGVDIMLDLGAKVIVDLTTKAPPFCLRFIASRGAETKGFGVLIVEPGKEAESLERLLLSGSAQAVTPILRISSLESREQLRLERPCYFAVKDGERYRYFMGGEAAEE